MNKIGSISLLCLVIATSTLADSDGYGCYGPEIIAWDDGGTGLNIVSFGANSGISKKVRVELPRKHGAISHGISCEKNKVSILLSGEKSQINDTKKYLMYVTEISVTGGNEPKITSDKPNHYRKWGAYYNGPRQVPMDNGIPINLLEEADFWLDNCRERNYQGLRERESILLDSDDEHHNYSLIFKYSNTFEPWENGGGQVTHRCVTAIEMRNTEGVLKDIVLIGDRASDESIH